ncbi:hopanoid-associated sugar epimerase [Desulforhabdus amnigena]|jgi:dihydroflavonol-4-reductase|uniref:Dihydroflavonol-4-reductase n=1 Tax=Desulforhabdus amnigena TaxID=40218 RepID=A0A9W6FRT1_9BACT|nr:hopanoid-associated sugar epimerase [Desulforhabdus amnigena]NLJ28371.1 NAD-dependent epimerase/dehydratase family protein [Deltaproteobacteria bacterium]GLI33348.1 dihydroflavonol-4-reductase [Desulforhabdus amnigena]
MATALVTGATGFIGGHIALLLVEKGWQVRALKRENSRPAFSSHVDIDWRVGDLRNPAEVFRALAGCDAVFHVAADYRLWARNPKEIYESNVRGTVNVMEAALAAGVDRVVYTSSVGALGLNPNGAPANEETPVRLEDMVGHYKRSKFLAEREAEKFLPRGLPLVMVHPSTPVGPGDHKPTPTGKIILDYLNGKMPAYLNTGLNLVHVKDVAQGHLLAMEKGHVGEKYILGNQNLTLEEIFKLLEKISGIPAPRIRLPYVPILILAYVSKALSVVTRKEPVIPFEGVKMARKYMFFDPSKAVRELGLPQTPVKEALTEAVDWFRENGYVC